MKKPKDIKTRGDIEKLVNLLYEEVKKDALLGSFFTQTNWETHLPVMYNFWESVLFYSDNYKGNPMEQHKYLHVRMAMTKNHFDRWILLFYKATDSLFSGINSDLIKERAGNIAGVMKEKILPGRENDSGLFK